MFQEKLQLSLTRQWFDMTEPDGKTEDYREINAYWCYRLMLVDGRKESKKIWEFAENHQTNFAEFIANMVEREMYRFVHFDTNIMTLGYPSKTDESKRKVFRHAGIEIRTGKQEWGAEPDKLYFVIKHGEQVKPTNK